MRRAIDLIGAPAVRRLASLTWLLALATACGARPGRSPRAPTPGAPHLTVMTYNVNYGLAGDPAGVEAIRAGEADLVILQETTEAWEAALRDGLGGRYPYMLFRHCCGAGGLAVLSRFPFEEKEYLSPIGEGWFPAWRVVVDSPLGALQVLAVHLRPALDGEGGLVSRAITGHSSTPPIRRHEIEAFAQYLDLALPTLVIGDFNEPPGGRALGFLAEQGLRSVLPEFAPGAATWRWPTPLGTLERQLDHIVYDPTLEPLDARVLAGGRSDHRPLVAIFERAVDP